MGRPAIYTDQQVVVVTAEKAKSRLQQGSQRRAIINHIIDSGGRRTFAQIDEHFGFDIRPQVAALVRAGWLAVEEGKKK